MNAQAHEDLLTHQETLYSSRNPTRRWLHRARKNRVVASLRENSPGGSRVPRGLEVGPGCGVYLPVLLEICDSVMAVDIERAYLDNAAVLARNEPRLTPQVDDITQTHLPMGSFDLILCSEVIEHLPDSRAALANLAGLLTPKGVLVLSTPQRWSLMEMCARIALLPGLIQVTRWLYGESVEVTGHINLLTQGQLGRQIAAAGLEVRSHWFAGLYCPFLAEFGGIRGRRLLQRWESRLKGTSLKGLFWTQFYVLRRSGSH